MFDSIFKDIGTKLKFLANLSFWICVGGSVFTGLVALLNEEEIGFLIILLGVLLSWLGNCMLYGFGDLVENVSEINKRMKNEGTPTTTTTTFENEPLLNRLDVLNKLKSEQLITEEDFKNKLENL